MSAVHYFLNDVYLGTGATPTPSPFCLLYVCTTCGKVWGRAVVDGGNSWHAIHAPCSAHKPIGVMDWGRLPGSFLLAEPSTAHLAAMWHAAAVETMPQEVLNRELHLALTLHEERSIENA